MRKIFDLIALGQLRIDIVFKRQNITITALILWQIDWQESCRLHFINRIHLFWISMIRYRLYDSFICIWTESKFHKSTDINFYCFYHSNCVLEKLCFAVSTFPFLRIYCIEFIVVFWLNIKNSKRCFTAFINIFLGS